VHFVVVLSVRAERRDFKRGRIRRVDGNRQVSSTPSYKGFHFGGGVEIDVGRNVLEELRQPPFVLAHGVLGLGKGEEGGYK
jgi:hypothetical protein